MRVRAERSMARHADGGGSAPRSRLVRPLLRAGQVLTTFMELSCCALAPSWVSTSASVMLRTESSPPASGAPPSSVMLAQQAPGRRSGLIPLVGGAAAARGQAEPCLGGAKHCARRAAPAAATTPPRCAPPRSAVASHAAQPLLAAQPNACSTQDNRPLSTGSRLTTITALQDGMQWYSRLRPGCGAGQQHAACRDLHSHNVHKTCLRAGTRAQTARQRSPCSSVQRQLARLAASTRPPLESSHGMDG